MEAWGFIDANARFCCEKGEIYLNKIFERLFRLANHHPFWQRWIETDWGKVYVDSADRAIYLLLMRFGFMGRSEKQQLESLVTEGMTVLEIGANIGYYSLFLAKRIGKKGKLVAFEPEIKLFHCLKRTIEKNNLKNVSLNNQAISSSIKKVNFCRDFLNAGNSKIVESENGVSTKITTSTLDKICKKTNPNLIKIDIQGHEVEAFQGGSRFLRNKICKPAIYFEYWPRGLEKAGFDKFEPIKILRKFNYRCYFWEKNKWKELKLQKDYPLKKPYTNLLAMQNA